MGPESSAPERVASPRWIVFQPCPRMPRLPWPVAAVVAIWAGLVALAQLAPAAPPRPLCNLRALTGLPCPTCGSTRAGLALLGGRPLEALAHNPLMVSAGLLVAAWLVVRLASGRSVRIALPAARRAWMWGALAAALAGNWAWVILRHA